MEIFQEYINPYTKNLKPLTEPQEHHQTLN